MNLSKFQDINKILVIRLSSMGDIILTTPVPKLLRKLFPEVVTDFLIGSEFSEIYKNNPYINKVIAYNRSRKISENRKLRNSLNKYDLIIDLQNNFRSRDFSSGLGNQIVRSRKNRLHKLSLVYLKKSLIENYSVIDNYLSVLHQELSPEDKKTELWLSSDKVAGNYLPDKLMQKISRHSPRIAIAPGANHFTKRYPAAGFIGLAQRLHIEMNAEIILTGGKKDVLICEEIERSLPFPIENCSGASSIAATAEHLDVCDFLITNDTGVMHIAAARRKPVISIFGSSVRQLGFAPYEDDFLIAEKELSCRPCSHIGRSSCPKKHFNCMNLIKSEDIFLLINKLQS